MFDSKLGWIYTYYSPLDLHLGHYGFFYDFYFKPAFIINRASKKKGVGFKVRSVRSRLFGRDYSMLYETRYENFLNGERNHKLFVQVEHMSRSIPLLPAEYQDRRQRKNMSKKLRAKKRRERKAKRRQFFLESRFLRNLHYFLLFNELDFGDLFLGAMHPDNILLAFRVYRRSRSRFKRRYRHLWFVNYMAHHDWDYRIFEKKRRGKIMGRLFDYSYLMDGTVVSVGREFSASYVFCSKHYLSSTLRSFGDYKRFYKVRTDDFVENYKVINRSNRLSCQQPCRSVTSFFLNSDNSHIFFSYYNCFFVSNWYSILGHDDLLDLKFQNIHVEGGEFPKGRPKEEAVRFRLYTHPESYSIEEYNSKVQERIKMSYVYNFESFSQVSIFVKYPSFLKLWYYFYFMRMFEQLIHHDWVLLHFYDYRGFEWLYVNLLLSCCRFVNGNYNLGSFASYRILAKRNFLDYFVGLLLGTESFVRNPKNPLMSSLLFSSEISMDEYFDFFRLYFFYDGGIVFDLVLKYVYIFFSFDYYVFWLNMLGFFISNRDSVLYRNKARFFVFNDSLHINRYGGDDYGVFLYRSLINLILGNVDIAGGNNFFTVNDDKTVQYYVDSVTLGAVGVSNWYLYSIGFNGSVFFSILSTSNYFNALNYYELRRTFNYETQSDSKKKEMDFLLYHRSALHRVFPLFRGEIMNFLFSEVKQFLQVDQRVEVRSYEEKIQVKYYGFLLTYYHINTPFLVNNTFVNEYLEFLGDDFFIYWHHSLGFHVSEGFYLPGYLSYMIHKHFSSIRSEEATRFYGSMDLMQPLLFFGFGLFFSVFRETDKNDPYFNTHFFRKSKYRKLSLDLASEYHEIVYYYKALSYMYLFNYAVSQNWAFTFLSQKFYLEPNRYVGIDAFTDMLPMTFAEAQDLLSAGARSREEAKFKQKYVYPMDMGYRMYTAAAEAGLDYWLMFRWFEDYERFFFEGFDTDSKVPLTFNWNIQESSDFYLLQMPWDFLYDSFYYYLIRELFSDMGNIDFHSYNGGELVTYVFERSFFFISDFSPYVSVSSGFEIDRLKMPWLAYVYFKKIYFISFIHIFYMNLYKSSKFVVVPSLLKLSRVKSTNIYGLLAASLLI